MAAENSTVPATPQVERPAQARSLLEVSGLGKTLSLEGKLLPILENVSFTVHEDEFVCLVGPSGGGKSTLLRIVGGLDRPDAGTVSYRGRPVAGPHARCAFVFQTFGLLPWLNVHENVEVGLEAMALPREERRRRAAFYIDKVGLDGYEEAYPRELSSGMKQRIGLARAFAIEPELLLMDEPFSSLDALTSANLREEVIRLWQDGEVPLKSVIMVTNIIEEAVLMADRILVLSKRPARIVDDIRIDLPRPRNSRQAGFHDASDRIFRLIL
jgi:NitT/TauT family transport system ATP-binding protein